MNDIPNTDDLIPDHLLAWSPECKAVMQQSIEVSQSRRWWILKAESRDAVARSQDRSADLFRQAGDNEQADNYAALAQATRIRAAEAREQAILWVQEELRFPWIQGF